MKTIFLIGFPASGKSTLGRELALKLGLKFVDLDTLVERRSGLTVGELFARDGEQSFRAIERACLADVLDSGAVVATGGGAPCHADNMELMNRAGVTVWLTAPAEVLIERLQRPEYKQPRPAVATLSDDEIDAYVRRTIVERTPYYSKAQIRFDTTYIETAAATRLTAERLARRLGAFTHRV